MNMQHVIFQDLNSALAALTEAEATGERIILESPPYAAQQMGAAVFLSIVDKASSQHPKAYGGAILDSGDEPGLALNALRLGVKRLRVALPAETFVKLAEIAEKFEARVENAL